MKSGKIVFRKTKIFHLLLPFVVLFNFGAICHAADLYVDDNTCPQTGSGTSNDPFCSIQYAITQAVSGDTVYVHDGTYAEEVIMKTGVDLRNIPAEQPNIVTSNADNHVLFDGVNNCTLDGFMVDDSTRTTPKGYGIVRVIGPGDGLAIKNCEIRGAPLLEGDIHARTGIRLGGQLSIEITGNTITRNQKAGIVTKNPDTIYDSTVTIQGNTITQNERTGIYLRGSGTGNRVIIGGDGDAANTIANNGDLRGCGMWLEDLQGVSIDNNEISNNGRAGILLVSVSTVEPHIAGNTIHDNFAAGINIGGDSTLTIGPNNEFYQNTVSGITFFVAENTDVSGTASSAPVSITGNTIHTNASAGISIIDQVTGPITINGNTIYQNEKAGIAFLNSCMAVITENDIYDHTGTAGISTGTWPGGGSPSPLSPPSSLSFNRANGPVELTINRNKIHDNLAGMRLDHASGTISNNLVYNNAKAGIRFSGNDIAPYEPFAVSWGITELTNNTVADNGTIIIDESRLGGGIVYDDINNVIDRNFFDPPVVNRDQGSRFIQNNIAAYNATAGIKDAACTIERDFNLYYLNFGIAVFARPVLGGCLNNPNEIFADPLFIDRLEYRLQPSSPAIESGNDNLDMGAYGGSNPITW
ncbi:MAG: hypothetical protein GQ559_05580 [Desulfobulbaceae bacterium]|nr:hypothetical protein [Desulfobulbaceae bacterium]